MEKIGDAKPRLKYCSSVRKSFPQQNKLGILSGYPNLTFQSDLSIFFFPYYALARAFLWISLNYKTTIIAFDILLFVILQLFHRLSKTYATGRSFQDQ